MTRSFGIVDHKMAEADFFLEQMSSVSGTEASFYFSAFVSAARSITFAMQASLGDRADFKEWYAKKQVWMKSQPICGFFVEYRNNTQKTGELPISTSRRSRNSEDLSYEHFLFRRTQGGFHSTEELVGAAFEINNLQSANALSKQYLAILVKVVFDCYQDFGTIVDPSKYYTMENLDQLGISIEDVEEELGFPRGWTQLPDANSEQRLAALKTSIPLPDVQWIFDKYLPLFDQLELS